MKVSPNKCLWVQPAVMYLGIIRSRYSKHATTKHTKDICHFVGMVNIYCDMHPTCIEILAPLTDYCGQKNRSFGQLNKRKQFRIEKLKLEDDDKEFNNHSEPQPINPTLHHV
jgi:hypothetical protein